MSSIKYDRYVKGAFGTLLSGKGMTGKKAKGQNMKSVGERRKEEIGEVTVMNLRPYGGILICLLLLLLIPTCKLFRLL